MNANRQAVVDEAISWIATPYHIGSRIKGVGVDCATLVLSVLVNCGVMDDERLGRYAQDWWKHDTKEQYMFNVLRHAVKVLESVCYRTLKVEPGNIVLGRVANSKVLNHAAIVINYPNAVHAISPKVCMTDLTIDSLWAYRDIVADPNCIDRRIEMDQNRLIQGDTCAPIGDTRRQNCEGRGRERKSIGSRKRGTGRGLQRR